MYFLQKLTAIIVLQIQFKFTYQKLAFYGDVSLFQFLKQFCRKQSALKYHLILIDQFESSDIITFPKKLPVNLFLRKIHCDCYTHYSNITLNNFVVQNIFNKKTQIILDLSNLQLNEYFNQIVYKISKIYSKCFNCFPFILYLDYSLYKIFNHISTIIGNLPNDFQVIAVSSKDRQTVHLRPVLNGCDLLDDLFVPKSTVDFSKLQVSSNKCSFSFKTLNISIVHVSLYSILNLLISFNFNKLGRSLLFSTAEH